jgi:two-component sensor histidine kinase
VVFRLPPTICSRASRASIPERWALEAKHRGWGQAMTAPASVDTGNGSSVVADRQDLVRELHHRVKNNLQIIVSLMNIQKRMLPAERRGEIRFLEEHVQSMAAAYRVVYASGELVKVPMDDLIREVVAGLVEIAGVSSGVLRLADCAAHSMIDLDQAIALGLYLAVAVPPYLDHAKEIGGFVAISTRPGEGEVTLSIQGGWAEALKLDGLRERLIDGHVRQLAAEILLPRNGGRLQVSLPTQPEALPSP